VANFNVKKIASIGTEHDIMDVAKIRGIVENAKQILEVTLPPSLDCLKRDKFVL